MLDIADSGFNSTMMEQPKTMSVPTGELYVFLVGKTGTERNRFHLVAAIKPTLQTPKNVCTAAQNSALLASAR